jgi:hypothetical protein
VLIYRTEARRCLPDGKPLQFISRLCPHGNAQG